MTTIPSEVRNHIYQRASGQCEYCRIRDRDAFLPHEIDHIYAVKHGGSDDESNLCLSCWMCNRHKGTDLTSLDPNTGEITPLFHPRRDHWAEHFRLDGAYIEGTTPRGRVTVFLLKMNRAQRIAERQIMIEIGLYP